MTEERFVFVVDNGKDTFYDLSENEIMDMNDTEDMLNELNNENEQLKKGMIGVVDRYIKNVDCNPPSSTHTYMKIKGALLNIREDLRDLIEDLE